MPKLGTKGAFDFALVRRFVITIVISLSSTLSTSSSQLFTTIYSSSLIQSDTVAVYESSSDLMLRRLFSHVTSASCNEFSLRPTLVCVAPDDINDSERVEAVGAVCTAAARVLKADRQRMHGAVVAPDIVSTRMQVAMESYNFIWTTPKATKPLNQHS